MINLLLFEDHSSQKDKKYFTPEELKYWKKLWDGIHVKYHSNQFFSKLWGNMNMKKGLTPKQWEEMEFILKNGRSRYEAGILPKNY